MDKPFLEKVVFYYTQEGNTDGTTKTDDSDGWETLTIEVQAGLDSISKAGGYLVVRTSSGWSIDTSEDLSEIMKYVENLFPRQNVQL